MRPGSGASGGAGQRTLIRNARQLLTLRGASGSRCGHAMSEPGMIPNGALLIQNGVIEEAGPARRIENPAAARNAREIDAGGRIVMPAFCDPDTRLVAPPAMRRNGREVADTSGIRVTSRRNLEIRGGLAALERARYGCITVGSHTACAADLRNTIKVLRVQKAIQMKPLRIRPIFSCGPLATDELVSKWLPAIRKNKLAAVIDLAAVGNDHNRDAAVAAAAAGFAIRVRSAQPLEPSALLLAASGGAIATVGPLGSSNAFTMPLSTLGCVRVLPALESLDTGTVDAVNVRNAIDAGAPICLVFQLQSRARLFVQHAVSALSRGAAPGDDDGRSDHGRYLQRYLFTAYVACDGIA